MLLEIYKNERCEKVSSRDWQRVGAECRYIKRSRVKLEVGMWNLKKFGCGRVGLCRNLVMSLTE